MNDPSMIDPFGDDSDLMNDPGNHVHDDIHASMTKALQSDILHGVVDIADGSHAVTQIAAGCLENNTDSYETEALIYAVSELIGKEKFQHYMDIARHRQRYVMWEQMVEIYEELAASPTHVGLTKFSDDKIAAIIAETSIDTTLNLVRRCRDTYKEIYEAKKEDYDESVIKSNQYSFNFWSTKSPRILNYLRHRLNRGRKLKEATEEFAAEAGVKLED